MKKIKSIFYLFLCLLAFNACQTLKFTTKTNNNLIFLDEYIIPNSATFEGTAVGGLSGIDYDENSNVYYVISDDRSAKNPARFYRFSFDITKNRIKNFKVLSVDTLRQANGKQYPNRNMSSSNVPDPESIRYYPLKNQVVWSSEGERIIRENGKNIIENPTINLTDNKGKLQASLPIPEQFKMSSSPKGPRRNGVFEGLSFTPDYKTLFVSTEEPLYNDGSRATLEKGTYWCRIIKYDFEQGIPVAQYAYPLDEIIQKPLKKNKFCVNGISEILMINDKKALVMERSYSYGRRSPDIRVYIADFSDAEDIKDVESLKNYELKSPVKKTLLYKLNNASVVIDNVEGITFGPQLPNGHKSLIFISDNNFNKLEKTQILLFDLNIDL